KLTSSAAAYHVKPSARLGEAQGLKGSAAGYGRSTPDLLAKFDPVSSSWRTSQLCLVEGLTVFSETWPRSGMMRNGTAYQLPPLVPLTDATASGLWPTPTVNGNYNRKGASKTSGDGLATAVKLWPTPSATDFKGSVSLARANKRAEHPRGKRLPEAVAVSDQVEVGGALNPTWVEWLMGFPIEIGRASCRE